MLISLTWGVKITKEKMLLALIRISDHHWSRSYCLSSIAKLQRSLTLKLFPSAVQVKFLLFDCVYPLSTSISLTHIINDQLPDGCTAIAELRVWVLFRPEFFSPFFCYCLSSIAKLWISLILGEQGWRSGDCTRLPAMWPEYDFGLKATSGLIWLLVLDSAPRGFSPGSSVFPLPQKINISKFQFDWMQDLPENLFRVSGASRVKIINIKIVSIHSSMKFY